ncbi:MAG: hypothetical protein MH219_19540 [Marinobacter sp.]|nr:hypothetical protein [Marinobacter sp.]
MSKPIETACGTQTFIIPAFLMPTFRAGDCRCLMNPVGRCWLSLGHVIAVSTAAFSLMDRPEEQFKAHFWVTKGSAGKAKPLAPEFVYYDAERHMLRFHLPKPQWRWAGRSRALEQFKVKVQIVLGNGGLLPASDMEQPLAQPAIEPGFSGVTPRWLTVSG